MNASFIICAMITIRRLLQQFTNYSEEAQKSAEVKMLVVNRSTYPAILNSESIEDICF
jgi:hypothetical protein